jgi:hypothetical protein
VPGADVHAAGVGCGRVAEGDGVVGGLKSKTQFQDAHCLRWKRL